MEHEPTYGQLRRIVYQMFVAESVYRAWGEDVRADDCRRIAVEILARLPLADFEALRAELTRRGQDVPGYRKDRKMSRRRDILRVSEDR